MLVACGCLPPLLFTAAVVYLPFAQTLFGTAGLDATALLIAAPFGLIVWGADELRRWRRRRRAPLRSTTEPIPG